MIRKAMYSGILCLLLRKAYAVFISAFTPPGALVLLMAELLAFIFVHIGVLWHAARVFSLFGIAVLKS